MGARRKDGRTEGRRGGAQAPPPPFRLSALPPFRLRLSGDNVWSRRSRIAGEVVMPYSFQVLGIAGSLRSGSYNRSLVRAAAELGPPGMQVVIFERLDEIPLYNEDLEAKGDPKPVAAFKTAIREADALLIATPEYNYGVPGPLKNAIDWASRPAASTPLNGKPAPDPRAPAGAGGGGPAPSPPPARHSYTPRP